jgi:hypothetical protein
MISTPGQLEVIAGLEALDLRPVRAGLGERPLEPEVLANQQEHQHHEDEADQREELAVAIGTGFPGARHRASPRRPPSYPEPGTSSTARM